MYEYFKCETRGYFTIKFRLSRGGSARDYTHAARFPGAEASAGHDIAHQISTALQGRNMPSLLRAVGSGPRIWSALVQVVCGREPSPRADLPFPVVDWWRRHNGWFWDTRACVSQARFSPTSTPRIRESMFLHCYSGDPTARHRMSTGK